MRAQNVPCFELVGAVSIILNTPHWWLQLLPFSSRFTMLVVVAVAIVLYIGVGDRSYRHQCSLCWHWRLQLLSPPSGPETEVNKRAGGLAPTPGGCD